MLSLCVSILSAVFSCAIAFSFIAVSFLQTTLLQATTILAHKEGGKTKASFLQHFVVKNETTVFPIQDFARVLSLEKKTKRWPL
jgi:hypothetical protein